MEEDDFCRKTDILSVHPVALLGRPLSFEPELHLLA